MTENEDAAEVYTAPRAEVEDGAEPCTNVDDQYAYVCNAAQGHEGDHVAYGYETLKHRWPADTGHYYGSQAETVLAVLMRLVSGSRNDAPGVQGH